MLSWIIIAVLVVLALLILRIEHTGRRVKVFVLIIIVALLYLSVMTLFSSDAVDLNSPRGIVNAIYLYFGWMGKVISNLWDIGKETANTVGNVIKLNMTGS